MAGLEPKFTIRKPNADEPTYIRVIIRYKYKELKVDTGDKILPIYWDQDNQRPTSNKKLLRNAKPLLLKELNYISHHLDEIEYFVNDLVLDLKRDKKISLDAIKEALSEFLGRKKEDEPILPIGITEYYYKLIGRMEQGSFLTDSGTIYTHGTIKSHKTCAKRLEIFDTKVELLAFDKISYDLYTKLLTFCNSEGYKHNTISKTISNLKFVMKAAYKEGVHTNEIFRDNEFGISMQDVNNIYLTLDELRRLYELDLTKDKNKEKVRDLFLIGCYTAQRFSDYSRFTPSHIKTIGDNVRVIDIVSKKQNKESLFHFFFRN